MPIRWLVNATFDLGWFAGPFAASLVLAWCCSSAGTSASLLSERVSWLLLVVGIDVAHVYATLFRTYLDPAAWHHHRQRLWLLPLASWVVGFVLYLQSPLWFWRAFAYLAVFHFIKQHEGFVALYQRLESLSPGASNRPRWPARVVLWCGTLGPIVWWHAHLPRMFHWFIDGDFIPGVPELWADVAMLVGLPVYGLYAAWRVQAYWRRQAHPMVDLMAGLPVLTWTAGMVWFNDDLAFTLTNVMAHGVAYFALVWQTGGRKTVARWLDVEATSMLPREIFQAVAVFLGVLIGLALLEEALWDHVLWHDHRWIFGELPELALGPVLQASCVAILMMPQATHYLFDRWLWRPGTTNPELARDLGLNEERATTP